MEVEVPRGSSGRRIGKIAPPDELLAYERIVRLPLDLAILFSAIQNFRLDLAKGYHRSVADWRKNAPSYFAEVKELLVEEDGCNLFPGDNAEPWIHVEGMYGIYKFPTMRVEHLTLAIDHLFDRGDASLLEHEFFPSLSNCRTNDDISKLLTSICHRFTAH